MVRVASLRICWDSNCFIAYLSEEHGRVEVCESILRAAERGEVELYASYMAFVETVRVPNLDERESDALIQEIFDCEYVIGVPLESDIAYRAQGLQRMTDIDAGRAIHLATALYVNADVLHTYDTDLLRLDCDALGLSIRIEEPR